MNRLVPVLRLARPYRRHYSVFSGMNRLGFDERFIAAFPSARRLSVAESSKQVNPRHAPRAGGNAGSDGTGRGYRCCRLRRSLRRYRSRRHGRAGTCSSRRDGAAIRPHRDPFANDRTGPVAGFGTPHREEQKAESESEFGTLHRLKLLKTWAKTAGELFRLFLAPCIDTGLKGVYITGVE